MSAATDRLCNVRTKKGPMDSIIEKGSFGGMMGGRAEVELFKRKMREFGRSKYRQNFILFCST